MKRYPYLQRLAEVIPEQALVVAASGTAREWFALRPSDGNIRTRTLGLVPSIALGMALELPHRLVVALDSDGAMLMNLCGLPTIALQRPPNLLHVLFDNGVYEASGGSATASSVADLVQVAGAAGYPRSDWADSPDEMARLALEAIEVRELALVGARIESGTAGVPEIPMLEVENKFYFARHIERTENRRVFSGWSGGRPRQG